MYAELPALLPLVCPACRECTERGREMFTLSLLRSLREATGAVPEIIEGLLGCDNPRCARRYPIIDGIPIIVSDLGAFLRSEALKVLEGDLHPETMALLCEGGPDSEPYPQMMEHLSTYLDAHFGDRSRPPPDGPAPAFGFGEVAARLSALPRVERAVELGCSVGRGLLELARRAERAVGLDLHFGALRRARRILRGEPVPYLRRAAGRSYLPVEVRAGDRLPPWVDLLCADALDPPLAPGGFDRVVALNTLDSLRWPAGLLSVMDGLCAQGGEVVLGSPYAWQSGIVEEQGRLGGADPAAAVRALLLGGQGLAGPYAFEEEAELRWWLRRDARSAQVYLVHYLRARKPV